MVDRFITGTEKGTLDICYSSTYRTDVGAELNELTVHMYIQVCLNFPCVVERLMSKLVISLLVALLLGDP